MPILLVLLGIILLLVFLYVNKWQQLEKERKVLNAESEKQILQTQKVLNAESEKQILQAQIEIQEQTFNAISQEIHDNIGQMLGLAKVQINIMDHSETIHKEQVKELKATISQAMSDLRDIAYSLNTDRIQSFNLSENVSHQAERINKCGLINVSIVTEGTEQQLEDRKKLILFRIIQECLQNIVKHSKATKVILGFCYTTELNVTISDDGVGFDISAESHKKGGLGLQNIVKRATVVGGIAAISSIIGMGTTIKITIPYA